MVKKLFVIMAFTFALVMGGPIAEAQAATNTATYIQVQESVQTKLMIQIKAEMDQLQLARPAGWWGWTQCLASVAVWVGTNATLGLKVASLVKKAGSIKIAIQKAMTRINRLSKDKKKLAVATLFTAVGAEILGIGGIVAFCFS